MIRSLIDEFVQSGQTNDNKLYIYNAMKEIEIETNRNLLELDYKEIIKRLFHKISKIEQHNIINIEFYIERYKRWLIENNKYNDITLNTNEQRVEYMNYATELYLNDKYFNSFYLLDDYSVYLDEIIPDDPESELYITEKEQLKLFLLLQLKGLTYYQVREIKLSDITLDIDKAVIKIDDDFNIIIHEKHILKRLVKVKSNDYPYMLTTFSYPPSENGFYKQITYAKKSPRTKFLFNDSISIYDKRDTLKKYSLKPFAVKNMGTFYPTIYKKYTDDIPEITLFRIQQKVDTMNKTKEVVKLYPEIQTSKKFISIIEPYISNKKKDERRKLMLEYKRFQRLNGMPELEITYRPIALDAGRTLYNR